MAKLQEIASRARDLFNQDYADRNEFFDLDDFKFHCAAKYSSLLNSLFQISRKENKIETGYSNVEINAQWLITQKVKPEDVPMNAIDKFLGAPQPEKKKKGGDEETGKRNRKQNTDLGHRLVGDSLLAG